jgi:hypothetical protein
MHFEGSPSGRTTLRFVTLAVLLLTSFGAVSATGSAAPGTSAPAPTIPTPPPFPTRIMSSDPETCDTTDSHRQTMMLKGLFPAIDAHGAALIVTKTGRQPIALPYDPKGLTVPSFSYAADARHALTIVYDGIAWCSGTGTITFQVALGGQMSNVYTMQIDSSDD